VGRTGGHTISVVCADSAVMVSVYTWEIIKL
jgi:hypothetical protein